jgi:hypothetical protein
MTDTAPWPYWTIQFDRDGASKPEDLTTVLDEVAASNLSDLIVMSHGWNNDVGTASVLYQRWFGMLPPLLATKSVGTLGVMWPSMLWPDEPVPGTGGGAAALPATMSPGAPVASLAPVYPDPAQRELLDQLSVLLDEQSQDPAALDHFHELMQQLAATEPQDVALEDASQLQMLKEDPQALATRFAIKLTEANAAAGGQVQPATGSDQGGAAVVGSVASYGADDAAPAAALPGQISSWLWNGAKEALRQLTYWQMKRRAGIVGESGLGPFLAALHQRAPRLRVHLIGHSFGGRLVSFALAGLPSTEASPVASVTLLEGALSHFAFASELPQDTSRSGGLSGMTTRVSGPLLACYSSHDLALAIFYPAASMAARDDAAALAEDLTFRWGAIGHDGAQAMSMSVPVISLGPARTHYRFVSGQFTNIEASAVVSQGGPPSGAHGDIFHPELAWAMLSAGNLVSTS